MNQSTTNRDQAGFTLVELMTAVAITVVLTGAALGLAKRAEAATARAVAELDAVEGWRVGLDRLAADLRAARSVRSNGENTTITVDQRAVAWSVRNGQAVRIAPGEPTLVVRQVRHLAVASAGRRHAVQLVVEKPGTTRVLELNRIVAGRREDAR
jgi:prepilin-type N-terminal cleavage/methylation domain-containing protein